MDERAEGDRKLTREDIRDLVKSYALACNTMLLFKESDIYELYLELYRAYLAGQSDIVIAVTRELLSSDELPEPVCSYWRDVMSWRDK